MADINLISEEEKQLEGFEGLRKKLSVVSIILLVFCAIATLGTLGYFTTLVSARAKLIDRVDEAAAKVDSFKEAEELVVVTKEKVSVADQIISKRPDRVKIFNGLAELVPKQVSLADLKLSQGKIVFSGQAATSSDISAFVSALVSAKGSQIVTGVSIDSLVSDDKGAYAFGISANLVN